MADQFNVLDQSDRMPKGARLRATGVLAETMARNSPGMGGNSFLTSGTESLVLIWLEAGTLVSQIGLVSSSTALAAGTNQWFSLRSSVRALLGVTADDTSTAWGTNTKKTLVMATPYLVPASGLYYVGIMVAAGTPPNLLGAALSVPLNAAALMLGGRDATNTGLTTPATAPGTSAALTAVNVHPYVEIL